MADFDFLSVVDDSSAKTDDGEKEPKKEGEAEKNGKEPPAKASNEVRLHSGATSFLNSVLLMLKSPTVFASQKVISIPDDDEKSPEAEQESKKNGEEPMETDKPSNGESESVKEKEAEKEKEKKAEGEKKSAEGGEEAKTEASEVKAEEPEVKGEAGQQLLGGR